MAGIDPDKDRQIIPRWRTFEETRHLGELDSADSQSVEDEAATIGNIDSRLQDWNVHKTVGHAADLVGAAIAVGRAEHAVDAARFLLRSDYPVSSWVKELANSALAHKRSKTIAPTETSAGMEFSTVARRALGERVRLYRNALREEPRDAIMCVDLARVYASLGVRSKAAKYMTIAAGIGGENRFVLRSACRLWIHMGEKDRAHDVVARAERTRHDPWLLAAEIGASGTLNRSPRYYRRARNMLADGIYEAKHTSELASGMATLELDAGNSKRSRGLFEASLEMPTENSIAQAAWASRRDGTIRVDERHLSVPYTFEARSWRLFEQGEWDRVIQECRRWAIDQSFSSRPNLLGSHVASVALEDYGESEKLARAGLVLSPDNFLLSNNLAFSLIGSGQLTAARKLLYGIRRAEMPRDEHVVWLATRGLLSFRAGATEEGRRFYLNALELARRSGNFGLYASAMAFYAVEEWEAEGRGRDRVVLDAVRNLRRVEHPNSQLLQDMVTRRVGKRGVGEVRG